MKIIACCKVVPDEELISVSADGTLNFASATPKISQYDLNAIESGKQLAAESSGTLTALSVGPTALVGESKIRKDILSRGADDLKVVVNDTATFDDSLQTAKALAEAVIQCEYDIVLCGMGSNDLYSQITGIQLGALLDVKVTNNITGIQFVDDSTLSVTRSLEDEEEVLEIKTPAVLCLSSEINVPPVPAMKEIMKAGKKPVAELSIAAVDGYTNIVEQLAPKQQERRQEIVEGDGEEAVTALVNFLKKEVL